MPGLVSVHCAGDRAGQRPAPTNCGTGRIRTPCERRKELRHPAKGAVPVEGIDPDGKHQSRWEASAPIEIIGVQKTQVPEAQMQKTQMRRMQMPALLAYAS